MLSNFFILLPGVDCMRIELTLLLFKGVIE
jgi:hypothetical protein